MKLIHRHVCSNGTLLALFEHGPHYYEAFAAGPPNRPVPTKFNLTRSDTRLVFECQVCHKPMETTNSHPGSEFAWLGWHPMAWEDLLADPEVTFMEVLL